MLTLTAGVISKEALNPSLVGERQAGRHSRRQLNEIGEGTCKSKIVARQRAALFVTRHLDVSHGPPHTTAIYLKSPWKLLSFPHPPSAL